MISNDLGQTVHRLPAARAKNRKAHTLPLSVG
jgi:hypothetical protein